MSLLCFEFVKYWVLFSFSDVGEKESDPSSMSEEISSECKSVKSYLR